MKTPSVLFEDEALLVVDKPSGMTVNRAETTRGERTVEEWVEEKILSDKKSSSRNISDFYRRAGIVHRLDKETSGLLLVAKTPESFANLQQQFKERRVKKMYLALVHGKVRPTEGEMRVPVGRLPWNRKRFGVVVGGREAVTRYKVQSLKFNPAGATSDVASGKNEQLTLVELYPETGRTHQIRVHLKYFGHPIFSDPLYAGRKTARADRKLLPRLFLHATKLSFDHPRTGKRVSFESPLPLELDTFLKKLA